MVAAAFVVHGVSIRSARLFTRADGSALDSFDVADDRTGGAVPEARWPRIASDLTAALSGEHDLTKDVAARADAYRSGLRANVPVSVRFPEQSASPRWTTIEVRCGDRIGRLAEIVAAFYAADLDISYAKLDTRAGEVVDTFSVRRNGHPIVGEAALQDLAAKVCAALQ
jgi:UTP:GlnB (protein PII) uridylyltransferase